MLLIVYNVIWVMECFTIIICLHIANAKKLRFHPGWIGILVFQNLLLTMEAVGRIPEAGIYCAYLLLFYYSYRIGRRGLFETVLRFVLAFVLAGTIEMVVLFFLAFIKPLERYIMLKTVFSTLLSIGTACFLYAWLFRTKKRFEFHIRKRSVIFAITLSGVLLCALVIDFKVYHMMNILFNAFILAFLFGIIAFLYVSQKKKRELELRDLEIELYRRYGEPYKNLVKEVRKRQHDYKNQIAALYSMHYVATSLEDLAEKQKGYTDELKSDFQYEQILTSCNNTILAGYLYYKCMSFQKGGVKVEYQIKVNQAECRMYLHELIEILGVLLDNAFEYVSGDPDVEKYISLRVFETVDNIWIEVQNPSVFLSSAEIEMIFREGYSTKGHHRGLGLYRVSQLAKACEADVIVSNQKIGEQNWISFKLIIKN